jgi:glycosyltransferase involved in cell wall biosynthesis
MGKAASRDGVQIFHGLSAELPYRVDKIKPRMKTIVTVHDLIYKRYPELYGTIDRQIYFSKLKYACKVADRIIATSACTMRDIVNYCGVTSEKIDVVYQGVSQAYYNVPTALEKEFVRNTYGLPESFILYVGTIEQRKNLMVLAQALRLLPESVSVVAIGRRTPYAEEVERYVERGGVSKRFKMLEGVPFRHLPTIYKMASLFVYPSRFEGFGIPIVEALVSGVPVIACTGSCLEEAGGPASIYVSPDDPSGLAKQIETLMNHPDRRNEMIKAGRDYAIRFTPTAIADALLKVYDNVLRF